MRLITKVLAIAMTVVLFSCTKDSHPTRSVENVDEENSGGADLSNVLVNEVAKDLVGEWETQAPESDTERSRARFHFEENNVLRVVVFFRSGGSINFVGEWVLDGEELMLTSGFFEPNGQSVVRCSINGDSLVLTDVASGLTQNWKRLL